MLKTAIVCLVSKDYESWAKVQKATIRKWAPEATYIICRESFLRRANWATQYEDTAKLLFANRPKVVSRLLHKFDQVILVGADVYFTGAFLREVNSDVTSSTIGVPHMLSPLPDDGKAPTNLGVFRAGQINADFTVWRRHQEVFAFLNWQARQLEQVCEADIKGQGVLYDQTFLNFAPSFIQGFKVLRHPGFNVAYYNLHERDVWYAPEIGWMVNDIPMYFFQFSGFYPDIKPTQLSKYSQRPEQTSYQVAKLMREFADKVAEA
jgi:hypothetical protein